MGGFGVVGGEPDDRILPAATTSSAGTLSSNASLSPSRGSKRPAPVRPAPPGKLRSLRRRWINRWSIRGPGIGTTAAQCGPARPPVWPQSSSCLQPTITPWSASSTRPRSPRQRRGTPWSPQRVLKEDGQRRQDTAPRSSGEPSLASFHIDSE